MPDWNVVVSVSEHRFNQACEKLSSLGEIKRTEFYNVLLLKVGNLREMLETVRRWTEEKSEAASSISRLVPLTDTYSFQSPEEFESKAREIVAKWVDRLPGKGFHVRMHRRGFKGRLSSYEEERFLDNFLLEAAQAAEISSHITFENPDIVIIVETVGQFAGLSFWTKEDLERYPFIRAD